MADDIDTIPEMLRYRAEHNRDKKVFSFYDRTGLVSYLTPYEIYTLAGKFAACLREWGFQSGDVIASGLPNSPERIVSDFGVILAGCVLANLQVIEKDGSDFWHIAKMSQCRGLIVPNRKASPAHKLVSPFLPDNSFNAGDYDVTIPQAPTIRKVVLCDRRKGDDQNSFLDFLRNRDPQQTFHADCSPSSLVVLFCTSGSSGFSKLISKSHQTVLESGRMFKVADSSLYYSDRPIGWIGGFPFEFLAFGGRKVTQDQFDKQQTHAPEAFWNIISTAGCTGAALLPGAVYELVDHFKGQPPEYKLQFITSSGQAMKRELMDAIGVLSHAVVVSYGSTEGGIFSADAITDGSKFKDFYCGKVLPDVQVRVVDDQQNTVDNGQEGEIYLKCNRLVKRYYNAQDTPSSTDADSDNTSEGLYTHDDWFKTGDRGVLHDDKSLFCYGRMGDVISIGPTLVYLSWPENILNKCPDIQDSSIVGLDTEEDGSEGGVKLCACVIPKTGSESLTERAVMDFFHGVMMDTGYKFQLKLEHVMFMDEFPVLPTGKVHKRQLKQLVLDKLKGT